MADDEPTEEEVHRILAKVAAGSPSPGVGKLVGKDIQLKVETDDGYLFVVWGAGEGGAIVGSYDLTIPAGLLLNFFREFFASISEEDIAVKGDKPDETREYMAQDYAYACLNLMLDNIQTALSDMLDIFQLENLLHSRHLADGIRFGTFNAEDGITPLSGVALAKLENLIKLSERKLKERLKAPRQGKSRINLSKVRQAFQKHGDDAGIKTIAHELRVTQQGLRLWYQRNGAEDWAEVKSLFGKDDR